VIKNNPKGFTLIEILIALAVIVILGTIAFPSYQEAVRKTRRAEGRRALMQVMQQQERYYSQSNSYIAFSSASTEANARKFKWYSGDSPDVSAYEINAAACPGEGIQTCVLLTAKPGTDKVNAAFSDPACGELSLTSTGVKKASGTASNCWK
jgi:type IV pilus assembly protein PilE